MTVVEAKTGYELTIEGERRLLGRDPGGARIARRRRLADAAGARAAARTVIARSSCAPSPTSSSRTTNADAVDVYCDDGRLHARRDAHHPRGGQALRQAPARARRAVHAHRRRRARRRIGRAPRVEHLEQLSDGAPAKLAAAGVVCNLLPGAALTLKLPWPDARRLFAAGCTVALGTDCNPGSSLTESLPLMMTLACTQMGLSAAEAWLGVTRAAARAVGRADAGHLGVGARGDLVVWDADDHRAGAAALRRSAGAHDHRARRRRLRALGQRKGSSRCSITEARGGTKPSGQGPRRPGARPRGGSSGCARRGGRAPFDRAESASILRCRRHCRIVLADLEQPQLIARARRPPERRRRRLAVVGGHRAVALVEPELLARLVEQRVAPPRRRAPRLPCACPQRES